MDHATGRAHALARIKPSSTESAYKQGYLDGLFERASVGHTAFSDRTITGLVFQTSLDDVGLAHYAVRDAGGSLIFEGTAVDMATAVGECEQVARGIGQPTARLSAIEATIQDLHPTLTPQRRSVLAEKVVSYILEHGAR